MIFKGIATAALMVLAACGGDELDSPQWIILTSDFGMSMSYGADDDEGFSIGCDADSDLARVHIRSFSAVPGATEVLVRLGDTESTLTRVNRDLPGVVAEAPLTVAWIDSLSAAEAVSATYSGQSYGPLALSSEWRDALVASCREIIAAAPRPL